MLHRAASRIARGGSAGASRVAVAARRFVSSEPVPITVARGDGIGPEIMGSTLDVLQAAGANLAIDEIEIGEKLYLGGYTSGIPPEAWDTLRRNKIFLKAPITTPTGGGYKSLNVSIRKTLGLYANVRPCIAYSPFIQTHHPDMDLVIVRENEEDTYAGIEHRQTRDVVQCLKLISRPGCERIARHAFEYAIAHDRKKVTCFVKDNIMKLTDGLFYQVFEDVGRTEYPEVQRERMIVDIGAAMLADRPEQFDVLLCPNLYGDIMSDIAAQLTGSVGLGASANIGDDVAMFEAIHGSAPDISGQDMANPSGLLLAAVQMLIHVGHRETATNVYNAWACAVEDGLHTSDIHSSLSNKKVGTKEFTAAIIERLGRTPNIIKPVEYKSSDKSVPGPERKRWQAPQEEKALHGVDVFVDWSVGSPDELADRLNRAAAAVPELELRLITNRGVKVWPDGMPETFCTDHWRCRFRPRDENSTEVPSASVVNLLGLLENENVETIKMEKLYYFDGKPGFSLGQGE